MALETDLLLRASKNQDLAIVDRWRLGTHPTFFKRSIKSDINKVATFENSRMYNINLESLQSQIVKSGNLIEDLKSSCVSHINSWTRDSHAHLSSRHQLFSKLKRIKSVEIAMEIDRSTLQSIDVTFFSVTVTVTVTCQI